MTAAGVEEPRGGVFGRNSFWRQPIAHAPVAASSAAMVKNLVQQVRSRYGGTAALNINAYGASWYTVGAGQPRQTVHFSNCQHYASTPVGLYGPGGQFVDVPLPGTGVANAGTDGELTVYQPSTDTLWDFWRASRSNGQWSACWGGRIDHVSRGTGRFSGDFGASASGVASEAGMVSINDVRSGSIDHAVSLALVAPAIRSTVSWPARRSDGFSTAVGAIPEGTRLRLDPRLDLSSLGLSPVGLLIAKAAQTYGFIVTDKSGAVAIPAESPEPTEAATGVDPWTQLLGGVPPYLVLKNFPWNRLQALPRNYGR